MSVGYTTGKKRGDQEEDVPDSGKTSTDVRGRDMGIGEGTGKVEIAEMRMLRLMCGVTMVDKIRNERIRGTTKVGGIANKLQEKTQKWCGPVMRTGEH